MRKYSILFAIFFMFSCSLSYGQTNPFGEDTTIGQPQSSEASSDGSTGEIALTDDNADVEIGRSWVNIRVGPGVQNSKVATLQKHTKGKVLEKKNGWKKIDFGNGIVGWVRGDLVDDLPATVKSTVSDKKDVVASANASSTENQKQIAKWERHFGDDLLNYDKFPWWWRLKRASKNFEKGKYAKALKLAQKANGNVREALFMQAKCLEKLGNHEQAAKILKKLERNFEDQVIVKQLDAIAKPYIDEPVLFKFGGYDTAEEYHAKKADGAKLGLESKDYYEKYVDIKTWKWRSKDAHAEFNKIAGIDCSGFVQKIQKSAFDNAGVKFPIANGRTSTLGLASTKLSTSINPGITPPPPPDIRPGDMILLDYGHNRYGHSMIYRGTDANGNISVLQMGNTPVIGTLSPSKFKHYKGTYRMNGMDKVRETMTA